jgi:hypothetical protein
MNEGCGAAELVGAACVMVLGALVSVLAALVATALLLRATLELAAVALLDCASCVLVATAFVDDVDVVGEVELSDPIVVTLTPRHSIGIPCPSKKTPMMLVSDTSSTEHTLLICCDTSTRPCTQAALQRCLAASKSSATHPLMTWL